MSGPLASPLFGALQQRLKLWLDATHWTHLFRVRPPTEHADELSEISWLRTSFDIPI
jgi:hypothetical protein